MRLQEGRSVRRAFGRVLAVSAAVVLLCPSAARAQLTTGSIDGVVTDESGGAVPGATVEVVNTDTGVRRSIVTDSQGRYAAPSLTLGQYEVRASLTGFGTAVRRGITMTAGRNAEIDLTLKLAQQAEEIVVTAEASPVETKSATVTHLVDEQQVEELPVLNRDLTQLAFLQPGVIKSPAGQGVFSGQGDKMTVAGARGTQNLFLLDGVASGDVSGNPQGVSGVMNGSETIQEMQIVTNNYSAEYRSTVGAIVSAVTKSGSNELHGSAFGYFRNDALNAENFFDKEFDNPKPDLDRKHFGGSVGGPIVRDKLFFFGSYEGLREESGFTDSILVPSVNARAGRLANGTVIAVPAAITQVLGLYPVPGQGNTIVDDFGDTVLIAGTSTQDTNNNFVVGKLDYSPSGRNNYSLTFSHDKGDRQRLGLRESDQSTIGASSRTQTVSGKWVSILSNTAVNDLHIGYSNSEPTGEQPIYSIDYAARGLIFRSGSPVMGEVVVPGIDQIGFRVGGASYGQKTLSVRDAFTLTRGSHEIRLGGEFSNMDFDVFNCSRGCHGLYDFSSLANFLRGQPRRFETLLPGGDIINRNLTQNLFGLYAQDNWRLNRTLTLNLGLRYEYATRIEEKDGFTSQLINITDPAPTVGPLYQGPPTKLALSPRLGFAWTPDEGKSSLRGGFGLFYEHPNLFLIRTALAELPPFTLVGRVENAPGGVVFPNAFDTQLGLARQRPNARAFDYDFDQTYTLRWNMTYQRQFGGGVVGSVDYTSSRGYNLWHQNLANLCRWQGYPDAPSGPKFFPATCQLINPNLGEIRYQEANARSWYNGLSLGLQRQAAAGLRFGGAFTWSKSVDQGSGVTSGGEELPQSQRGIYGYDLALKQGLSAHDRRIVFSSYASYELPWGRDAQGITRVLTRGWQLNAIFSYLSGNPLSVIEVSDAQTARIGDDEDLRPNLVPGGNNNPVTGNPERWFDISQFTPSTPGFFGDLGRNTITAPSQKTLDVSVLKDVEIGLGYLQLRAEVFNILNTTNYGEPDMTAFINGQVSPTAGRITTTNTPARRMQLGLRWVF